MWLLSGKESVEQSGVLSGFRDVHCHLLPGVDDGVGDSSEAFQVLSRWESVGVREVWLTPHVMEDIPNTPGALRSAFSAFCSAYAGPVRLRLSAEHMLDGSFPGRLESGGVLPLGEGGGFLLVETSYYIPPMNLCGLISLVKQRGYVPVLAHPERYRYMSESDYQFWKSEGVLFQLNVPSLVGAYGPSAVYKSRKLLSCGLYDCCGTDIHSVVHMEYFLRSMIDKKTAKKVKALSESQIL